MKINEVEQRVGITKKNIRFYEQQLLLNPKRNSENGYRDYTEEDVKTLEKIKLLRKLSIPIEEIRRIQNGDLILEDALHRQVIVLEREKKSLEETIRLCRALGEEQCQYQSFPPENYLERMEAMEKEGTKFLNVNKQDVAVRKIGAIGAAVVMILIMTALIGFLIWGYTTDPIPIWVFGFFILIPVVAIIAIIAVLRKRIKEIEGGEEDAARKY